MLHALASPKPSPEGCTTRELRQQPPPVKKPAARCLHELQDPSSPTKPRKLYRTESTYGAPIPSLDLGVAQFTAEHKQVDEVMQNMLDEKMVIDPSEKIPMTQGASEDPAADDLTQQPAPDDPVKPPADGPCTDALKPEPAPDLPEPAPDLPEPALTHKICTNLNENLESQKVD